MDVRDSYDSAAEAFYSIVHLGPDELGAVFQEARRVLRPGGLR